MAPWRRLVRATYDTTAGLHGMDSLNETTQGNAGNTFGSGLNTHVTGSMTLPGTTGVIATTTTNSLTLTTGALTLSFVNASDTLALQSGGVLFGLDANARSIGQSQGYGNPDDSFRPAGTLHPQRHRQRFHRECKYPGQWQPGRPEPRWPQHLRRQILTASAITLAGQQHLYRDDLCQRKLSPT